MACQHHARHCGVVAAQPAARPRKAEGGGKAAPAYHFAKLVIKFINNLAGTIDGDPAVRGRINSR